MSAANPLSDALDDLVNEATAIEPQRVMILDEAEQSALLHALDYAASLDDAPAYMRLSSRIGAGETYVNSQHEFAALEVRKKRLEEEIGRIKRRKADLLETVLDALAEAGARTMREQITDRLLLRKDDVRLAYADPDWSSQQKAIAKETAGDVFQQLGEPFASMLKQDWNHRRVESLIRERYEAALDANDALPEHERRPIDPQSFIPDELRSYYRLSVEPRIQVNQ